MTLLVREIDTANRRDAGRFINFPFDLYRDSEHWVPALMGDAWMQLDRRRNPYYEHSDAAFFLAERDGNVVGRIAVLDNRHYNEHWRSNTAFFNLFDVENDLSVAESLFSAAEAWARGRGLKKVVGAKGFLQGDGIGILVKGFDRRPAMGIPYNYEYYGGLIESCGYSRQRDFISAYMPATIQLPPRLKEIAERMAERRGFTIRRFANKAELRAAVPAIVKLYNDTFVDNWEFNPVTEAEAKVIGDRFLQIADPRYIKLVMKGDQIAGFLFGFTNISDGLRKAKGRLWPFGWFWILRDLRNSKYLDLNGAGILEQYRGLGINAILYNEMEKTIREGRFHHTDLTQMEESVLTLNDTVKMGGELYKTHRIYEKALE